MDIQESGVDELVPDEGVRLTSEPHDAVVEEGDSVVLACAAARGAKIHWRHRADGPPRRDDALSSEDKYRKQLANGSLLIESMSATLAGHYQCVATGSAGSVVSRVALLYLAEVPPLVPGPRSILGTVGAPALLPCGVSAPPRVAVRLQGPAALPERKVYSAARLHSPPPVLKLNVTWLKNGSPVRLEAARVSVTPSGALELDPLRPHDAATYRCRVALSPHKHRTGEEMELRVSTAPPDEEPPRFVATPQPITVIEGASVTFDCAAVGNPKPEITWLNNVGVAIDLNDLDSRFYLVGSGSLRVQAARGLDAGSYTCRAHSRLDSADSATTLTVLTAPRVALPAGAVVAARTRGDVTLRCDVRGRGATVSWLKDGEPLTPNQHDIALVDGSSLRIQGVLRVDAGMFQCAATGPAGGAVAALRLVVLPPDDELASLPSPPDIFNSLVPDPESPDFLGETSPAFTHPPDYYDYTLTEGLELGRENGSIVSPPRELRAVIVKHRFVTLSWLEPARKMEEVVGYVVVYRVKGSERERVSRGSATRFEMNVATLQPNTTYVFSTRALTLSAISPPTETIEAHTAPEELSFGPPTNVKVEAAGPHSLRVKWSPPAQDPQPPHYTVHYTEVETGRSQVVTADAEPGGGGGGVTLAGLRAAAAYAVAVAGAGGAAAEPVRARTLALAPLAPPVNVSAEPTSPTSILVRWEAPPARTHRGPLTGYKVRFRAAGARKKADSLTTAADARRAELRDLDPHTTYQIRVCAINANGSGPFSEWLTAATQARAQDESRVPPQPPPLSTRAGRDWISVWWEEGSEGGSLVRGYRLGWGLGVPDVHGKDLPAATHHHVIRGLESNAEYVISLHASNALGAGPPVYATVRTKAAAEGDDLEEDEEDDEDEEDEEERPPLIPPVGLKVIMLSGSTAVVYWTDPTLPKGQTATDGRRYVVRYAAAGAGQRPRSFNATDLNCMLDDLKPFTLYEFAVKLIKGGQESAWSMLVSNTTLEAAPASAPRDLRAAPPAAAAPAAAARAVDLTWTPPAKPNGVITGYTIMYGPAGAGAGDWTVQKAEGDRPRARVERLRPRTTYSFKVQAKNSKGVGPFCAPISYTTGIDTGGGGLAGATSAWLWASAGGACAVLALAAALALSLCCRKAPPLSPHTSTYQKSSASAGIKPPDLWIHHDQMELKHLDKSLHSSAISAGSVDGPSALASSTLTLTRAPAEYEPARHPPPASLDRRHYVPTYVGQYTQCSTLTRTPAEYEPARHPPPASLDRRHYVPTYVGQYTQCSTLTRAPAEYEPARHPPPASLDRRHYVPTYVGQYTQCSTLTRAPAEYEPARHPPPASLDRRHYVPTYVGQYTQCSTLTRAPAEYEPARHPPPASLDRRHYVPTYVGQYTQCLTLTRAPAEYEPARHPPPASLDRRHYVPTYVGQYTQCLTLTRAPAEYEPARHPPPASLDRRHYVPTYVGQYTQCSTLTRAPAEYEPARHPPPASLDRRHYVPTYVERERRSPSSVAGSGSGSGSGSDDTAPLRASPFCNVCAYRPMTGMGVGVGVSAGGGGGGGCAAACERRALRPPLGLPHPDQQECFQSTPLLAGVGVAPLSPQSSLASLHAHAHAHGHGHGHPAHAHAHNTLPHAHPPPAPCGGGTCPLGAACAPLGGGGGTLGGGGGTLGGGGGTPAPPGSDIYACAARERGHYVAYEPLGHYTHRDSMSSEAGGVSGAGASGASGASGSLSGTGGSLQRRACAGPLHSFADSPHSTPSHGQGSVRETSPYKKSNSSSPGHIPNRLQLGGSVAHCPEELEALTPSRSTERLAREMQNLEGLMKDLSAITQQQFHC